MKLTILAAGMLALALAACATPVKTAAEAAPATGAQSEAPPPIEAEKAACAKRGGAMQQVGFAAWWACAIPFPDAGKVCANDADCAGECWTTGVPAGPNKTARGQCQPTNLGFGCHARLDKGVVSEEICMD